MKNPLPAGKSSTASPPIPALKYPWHTPPAQGAMHEVADGVFWIRMPLPFALDHINLWLLADGEGWTLVDCGICNKDTKSLWHSLLAKHDQRPLKRIIVTHFHPDHLGLAGWLQAETAAQLWMTRAEWQKGSRLYQDTGNKFSDLQVALFRRHGLQQARLAAAARGGNRYRTLISRPPTDFQPISDDEQITVGAHSWRVIVGAGHAPEHACLHCEDLGVLISGDQILPRITPNISLSASEPDANPLKLYLDSLQRFTGLPERTLVLPSHGAPFYGLQLRLHQIREHHHERLEALFDACREPHTAAEMMSVMFKRELDDHQVMFAMGESLSHLAFLKHQNRLTSKAGDRGIVHYWQGL